MRSPTVRPVMRIRRLLSVVRSVLQLLVLMLRSRILLLSPFSDGSDSLFDVSVSSFLKYFLYLDDSCTS